ncbi:hypothetical protein BDZ45DRAFT_693428 [Acephala macrosclerotiorum]|nr:hypothetical protein BDZ45DRAFT_693428 [Acephala macrosclerotiorum]
MSHADLDTQAKSLSDLSEYQVPDAEHVGGQHKEMVEHLKHHLVSDPKMRLAICGQIGSGLMFEKQSEIDFDEVLRKVRSTAERILDHDHGRLHRACRARRRIRNFGAPCVVNVFA